MCKKVRVRDIETGIVYNSVQEAADELSVSRQTINYRRNLGLFEYVDNPVEFLIDENGRECADCHIYQPWTEYYLIPSKGVRLGYCKSCQISRSSLHQQSERLPHGKRLFYGAYSKALDAVVYVGMTEYTLKNRIKRHKSDAKHRPHQKLHHHIIQYGIEDIEWFEIAKGGEKYNQTTEHEVAVMFGTYRYYNIQPCDGCIEDVA